MNIEIVFKNIPSSFVFDQRALSVLTSVAGRIYLCDEVTVIVTTTNEYVCSHSGHLIPLHPVEIQVSPNITPGEKTPHIKDFSLEAVVIGLRLYELLKASQPKTLNLPSKVKIVGWDRMSYSFLGRESLDTEKVVPD